MPVIVLASVWTKPTAAAMGRPAPAPKNGYQGRQVAWGGKKTATPRLRRLRAKIRARTFQRPVWWRGQETVEAETPPAAHQLQKGIGGRRNAPSRQPPPDSGLERRPENRDGSAASRAASTASRQQFAPIPPVLGGVVGGERPTRSPPRC